MFGAFSQVDGSARREYGGSGLGLAISKKLTELMGGTIRFESEEGIGTTFYVSVIMDAKEYSSPPFSLNKMFDLQPALSYCQVNFKYA